MLRRGRCFTLLELITALCMMGILMTSVVSVFRAGLFSQRTGLRVSDDLASVRGAFAFLQNDLRHIVPGNHSDEPAEEKHLNTIFRFERRTPNGTGIESIAYRFDEGALIRTRSLKGVEQDVELKFTLIEGLSDAVFHYKSQGKWNEKLNADSSGPEAIKVMFDHFGKNHERVLHIPKLLALKIPVEEKKGARAKP